MGCWICRETVEGVKEEEKPAVEGAVVDEKKPEPEASAEVVAEEGAAEKKEEEEEDNVRARFSSRLSVPCGVLVSLCSGR